MANPNVAKYKEESKIYRAQQMVTRVLAYIFLVFELSFHLSLSIC